MSARRALSRAERRAVDIMYILWCRIPPTPHRNEGPSCAALLLYLGVRRGDVVKIGPSQVKDGWLHMVPRKTRHKRKDVVQKPILPVLARIISETCRREWRDGPPVDGFVRLDHGGAGQRLHGRGQPQADGGRSGPIA